MAAIQKRSHDYRSCQICRGAQLRAGSDDQDRVQRDDPYTSFGYPSCLLLTSVLLYSTVPIQFHIPAVWTKTKWMSFWR